MIKMTIVIPVYNAEKYLDQCLNSIMYRKPIDVEVIVVDDGSTDKSFDICKKYEDLSKNIRVFHKNNTGVSDTRNFAIKKANGKYITFVDSDDFLSDDYYNVILNDLEDDKDIYIFEYNQVLTNRKIAFHINKDNINNKNFVEEIFKDISIGGYLWNKIFKLDIIKSNNIYFDKNISYCEDLLFVCSFVKYVEKYKVIEKTLYNYRMRKNSVSNNYVSNKNLCIFDAYDKILNLNFDYKTESYIKFCYLLHYYRLKKFVSIKEISFNEKEILNGINISKKQKIKFYILKYFNFMYMKFKLNSKSKHYFD